MRVELRAERVELRLGELRLQPRGAHGALARLAAVAEGDAVQTGQSLLWVEAMKMEHHLAAPFAGTVTAVYASRGAQVALGEVLLVMEES